METITRQLENGWTLTLEPSESPPVCNLPPGLSLGSSLPSVRAVRMLVEGVEVQQMRATPHGPYHAYAVKPPPPAVAERVAAVAECFFDGRFFLVGLLAAELKQIQAYLAPDLVRLVLPHTDGKVQRPDFGLRRRPSQIAHDRPKPHHQQRDGQGSGAGPRVAAAALGNVQHHRHPARTAFRMVTAANDD